MRAEMTAAMLLACQQHQPNHQHQQVALEAKRKGRKQEARRQKERASDGAGKGPFR